METLTELKPASEVKSSVPTSVADKEEQAIAYAINTAYSHYICWNHPISKDLKTKLTSQGYTIRSMCDPVFADRVGYPYIIGGF